MLTRPGVLFEPDHMTFPVGGAEGLIEATSNEGRGGAGWAWTANPASKTIPALWSRIGRF